MEKTIEEKEEVIEPLMTVGQIARLFRLHPSTIYHWAATGELKGIKLKRSIRFRPSVVNKFIDELEKNTYGEAA